MTETYSTSNPLAWYYLEKEFEHLFPRLSLVPPEPPPLTTLDRMLTIGKDIGVIR